ncbi:MAG: hypothetical protein ACW7DR_11450 [Paraglaciecola chathamensis]
MQNRFSNLLTKGLTDEVFSRQALGLLEAEIRELALLSLQEWLKLKIVSPDLFSVMANLRYPAWGISLYISRQVIVI